MTNAPAIGQDIRFSKTMTVAEQALFTGISGNLGGLYVDRTKARDAGLADMAVFELAASALLTTCLSRLAGPAHRIANFSVSFAQAVPVGTTIAAKATVTSLDAVGALTCALEASAGEAVLIRGTARLVPVSGGADV
ncbi:MaoC family dehydratase [Xanthobacter dioxanivorans]|uniref:MaoC family dehydratase n=1 Tax=Xanthobacter dioxanivorans TaxID=2528964 RepID=A0A974PL83_9HYPH|nr:MaoC family dehydratase [Xanthobacter dioxanivorans]QRG05642.1 MaoC family dehydratase [Xanthobacter dioxanivorans]